MCFVALAFCLASASSHEVAELHGSDMHEQLSGGLSFLMMMYDCEVLMATSTMPGSTAAGGVLRPVAALLGSGTCATAIQPSSGATSIHASASRSGVSGMPIERSEGGLTL